MFFPCLSADWFSFSGSLSRDSAARRKNCTLCYSKHKVNFIINRKAGVTNTCDTKADDLKGKLGEQADRTH